MLKLLSNDISDRYEKSYALDSICTAQRYANILFHVKGLTGFFHIFHPLKRRSADISSDYILRPTGRNQNN